MSISCAAIICVRNEERVISTSISAFLEQGVDVIIIDHESEDDTKNICQRFLNQGLLDIVSMPWRGRFELAEQLAAKNRVENTLSHDWIIHADADEWFLSNRPGETLAEGLGRLSGEGFNVVNFEEFVFVPTREQTSTPTDFRKDILTYYFFEPEKQRLMRAWKRNIGATNLKSGGHRLFGSGIRVAPEQFLLRHYVALSQDHATGKYLQRRFSREELNRGWHRNRVNLTAEKLRLPSSHQLKRLDHWQSREFDRSDPRKTHFWEW